MKFDELVSSKLVELDEVTGITGIAGTNQTQTQAQPQVAQPGQPQPGQPQPGAKPAGNLSPAAQSAMKMYNDIAAKMTGKPPEEILAAVIASAQQMKPGQTTQPTAGQPAGQVAGQPGSTTPAGQQVNK